MTRPVIEITNLSKRYRLGGMRSLDRTFREMLYDRAGALVGRARRSFSTATGSPDQPEPSRDFWALREVSFNVAPGEVMGIVGANGAGKSTLLKILARITDPTAGRALIRGRVGSLLEVGTGFHPELTGRENIYLNGAVLGMKRREIAAKFDEIVDFSGVERFLDTPVKRYSSGMKVRLAFAVAAHLNPEVLIVDEVLAVGDAAFQEKCLGKMKQVATGEGRTVLFVSHNMAAVSALCHGAIWLDKGRIVRAGPAHEVVDHYIGRLSDTSSSVYVCSDPPRTHAWIRRAEVLRPQPDGIDSFLQTQPVPIAVDLEIAQSTNLALSVQVQELNHNPIFHFHTVDADFNVPSAAGTHRVVATLPAMNLYPGEYLAKVTLSESAGSRYQNLHASESLYFVIRQDPGLCTRPLRRQGGLIYRRCHWRADETTRLAA